MESETYKAIELNKYGGDLKVVERPIPTPQPGQVLIKIITTTIHPADMFFLKGQYGSRIPTVFPLVPGFEASGIVVKVGAGVPEALLNKRVCTFANSSASDDFHGLWAQYAIRSAREIVPFDDSVPFEKINFFFVNPMTCVGFIDTIKKHNVKAIVNTASNGALGRMTINLCQREGIETINLIRKDEHIEELKQLGAKHFVNTSSSTWEDDLKKLSNELNATICFDCTGGDVTGRIISAMPAKSTIYHFGNLEAKRLSHLSTADFIFFEKELKGWWLSSWLFNMPKEEIGEQFKYAQSIFVEENSVLETKFSKKFELEDIEAAFEYYCTHMSDGKILLCPNGVNYN